MRLRDVSKILYHDRERKEVDRSGSLKKAATDLKGDWRPDTSAPPPKSKYLIYLVAGTFLFFLATIGIAYFVQFAGIDRTVSTSKIAMITDGPRTADSGVPVPLVIRIVNRNPVPIRGAILSVTYPEGSYRQSESGITHLRSEDFPLQTVETGEVKRVSISPLLYGKEEEPKMFSYDLLYQVDGASQPTQLSDSHEVILRSSPIRLHKPRHTNPVAGKEVTLTMTVQSNTAETIPAVFAQATYPVGFAPTKFLPRPFNSERGLWKISPFLPGSRHVIQVSGIISGEEHAEQAVVVQAFAAPTGEFSDRVEVAREDEVLVIARSFLTADLRLKSRDASSSDTIIVAPGDEISADVHWANDDTARLRNLVLTVSLSGTGLDESSIRPSSGGYRDDDALNEVIWDRSQVDRFASVPVGGRGSVSINFRALPDRPEFAGARKHIRASVSARADRVATRAEEYIKNIDTAQANLRSELRVAGNTLRSTSVLRNTGPIPPRVGETTSYTLKYFIKNSGNDLANVLLTIPLTRHARLTGFTSGLLQGELRHNQESNEITIRIPSLSATGPQATRSIEIQVAVTPSSGDAGSQLALTKTATYEARDTFVDTVLRGNVRPLTIGITAEKTVGDSSRVVP